MQNPAQAKEKSPLGGEGGSCGEEDCLGRSGEDCTPGEDESLEGLAANSKPLLRYLNNAVLGASGFPKLDVFLENFRRGRGGSFPIQKITLQIFLVSKRYILVVNFGKNVQKGGRGGGVISNPKKFIANLRKLTNIYEFSQKKAQCNFRK